MMSPTISQNINSPQLPEINLNLIAKKDFFVKLYDSVIEELGTSLGYLYALLSALSTDKGYCYASTQFLTTKVKRDRRSKKTNKLHPANKGERQILRDLKTLEDEGWIYRNTWKYPGGTNRHIVVKSEFKRYWKSYLSKENIPKNVQQKFLEKALNIRPQKTPTPPPKPGHLCHVHTGDISDTSLLLRNNIDTKKRAAHENAAAFFPNCLRNEIKKLSNLNISEPQIEEIISFTKKHPEIELKSNPVGWIISGIKEGWIFERLQQTITNQHKKEDLMERNRNEASVFYQNQYKKLPKFLNIELSYKSLEFIPIGAQCNPVIIEFDNPRFRIEFEKAKERFKLL